jgi:putative colanic acid biosynthesis acetyltransferase WcaF
MAGITQLNTFNNSWYNPGKNALLRLLWYYVNLLFFQTALFPFSGLKVFLLRIFGASVGNGVVIKPSVNIKYPWCLHIGDYVWIGEKVWIDNLDNVYIGNNVCISQGALILSGNHNYKKSTFDLMLKEIRIDEGVWIGAKAIVCQGVHCKSHAVLKLASVASSDLEPYTIYAGNPAVKVKERHID